MKKTLFVGFLLASATAFAANNGYKVAVTQDSVVEGKTLKAGEYRITVENGNAVIKQGKESIEVPARVETEPNKVYATEITYGDHGILKEIRVGGTNARIVFEGATPMSTGQ
jgi:hypothetical protein